MAGAVCQRRPSSFYQHEAERQMKNLWAPWRIEYILGQDKPPGCIFCPWPEENLSERLVLFSGRLTRVMMNKYPYNNGHLLIFPLRHVPYLEDLTPAELLDLQFKLRHAMRILRRPCGRTASISVSMWAPWPGRGWKATSIGTSFPDGWGIPIIFRSLPRSG